MMIIYIYVYIYIDNLTFFKLIKTSSIKVLDKKELDYALQN